MRAETRKIMASRAMLKKIEAFATGETIEKTGVKLREFFGEMDCVFSKVAGIEDYYFCFNYEFFREDARGRNLLAIDKAGMLVWLSPRLILKFLKARGAQNGNI